MHNSTFIEYEKATKSNCSFETGGGMKRHQIKKTDKRNPIAARGEGARNSEEE